DRVPQVREPVADVPADEVRERADDDDDQGADQQALPADARLRLGGGSRSRRGSRHVAGFRGMRWARKRPLSATNASNASDDVRPEIRALRYASSAASDASSLAPALSKAACRSASETNGTPPASCTCACDLMLAGIAGLWLMSVRKADVTAAIITEPASAVPIDAPRFVIVFCTPPTSGLRSSGTAETVTAPS